MALDTFLFFLLKRCKDRVRECLFVRRYIILYYIISLALSAPFVRVGIASKLRIINLLIQPPVIMLTVHQVELHANGSLQFGRSDYTSGELV